MNKHSLLAYLVVVGAFSSGPSAALAQQDGSSNAATPSGEMRTFAAIGAISNIQYEGGSPAWILAGGWKLRASLSDDNSTASFNAGTRMVRMDGSAMHSHRISDFALESWSENNNTMTFNGTVTVTLRDGPQQGVPVSIIIYNGGAIGISIDSEVVNHFGSEPMYGLALRTYDSRGIEAQGGSSSDGPDTSSMPTNATDSIQQGITSSLLSYYPNATGYLAYPTNGTALPAVVMIHEWWGLNENIKNEADKLASHGYAVLAVDLYNGRVATESESAMAYSAQVRNNPEPAIENLKAAASYMSDLPNVNSSRIASLGWCFGGGWSLQLALSSEEPLAATVIYYGSLVTEPEALSSIEWPVLGIFGSEDQSIPVNTVRQFEAALEANEIPNEIHIYEGVGHAFANPSGDNFAQQEAVDAWTKTLDFLSRNV